MSHPTKHCWKMESPESHPVRIQPEAVNHPPDRSPGPGSRALILLQKLFLVSILVVLFYPAAWAQTEQIVVVPFRPSDPTIPFPAHTGAIVSLKAILRNASASTYTVYWDFDGNGTWDFSRVVSRDASTNSVRDIGATWIFPYSPVTKKLYLSTVRVHNNTNGSEKFAQALTLVENWQPDHDPQTWTNHQVEVLQEIAIQENLWYLHKRMICSGNGTAGISGYCQDPFTSANLLELFAANRRFPAYPPGTLNWYGTTPPSGWEDRNTTLWNTDPYAEDALRMMNYLLVNSSVQSIPAGCEDNTCGYDSQGNELLCSRIDGTNNNSGIRTTFLSMYADGGIAVGQAQIVSGLAHVLTVHAGVPSQVGPAGIISKPLGYIVQEYVDYLAHYQIDAGTGLGGYYYDPVNGSYNYSMGESASGVAMGLYDAQIYGSLYGIVVNNKVKYRLAENLVNQAGANGLVRRWLPDAAGGMHNSNYTAGYIGICYWLGIDQFDASSTIPAYPGYCSYTKGQLRQVFNNYLTATAPLWNSASKTDSYGWLDHFWKNGDYLCGDINDTIPQVVLQNHYLGSTFNMFQWAQGLNKCYPPAALFGTHDWKREIIIHLIRGETRNYGSGLGITGQFVDDYCSPYQSHSCIWGYPDWCSVLAGRTLSALNEFGVIWTCEDE